MNNNTIRDLGELELINIIEKLVFKKTRKKLIRDDSFFLILRMYNQIIK